MGKKIVVSLLATFVLASVHPAEAQQPKKIPRIGYLTTGSLSSASENVERFRRGLRELGYVEGKTITIEYRYAGDKLDPLPDLAAELVQLKVDVIVVLNTAGAFAPQASTPTIPLFL